MDVQLLCSYFLLGLLVAVFLKRFFSRPRSQSGGQQPPGPGRVEVLWAVARIMKGSASLEEEAEKWAAKYGDVVLLHFPFAGTKLLLNTASAVRDFMTGKTTSASCNDRSESFVADNIFKNKDLEFSPTSENEWTTMRKVLHSSLKMYGDGVAKFEGTVQKELQRLVCDLEDRQDQEIILKDHTEDSFVNVLTILYTGEWPENDAPVCKAIKRFNHDLINLMTPRFGMTTTYIPALAHVPGTWCHDVWNAAFDSKQNLMKHLFYDVKASWTPMEPRGLVDTWLDEQKKGESDWLTDDHVQGLIMDIASYGGLSTSRETLASVFFFLLHHPDISKRIQTEIDGVVETGQPKLEHRARCSYTEATILETLRCLSPVELGVPRKVTDDVEFRGFQLPKGMSVMTNQKVMHKAEATWGDPDNFRPERFLDDSGELLPATHPLRQQLVPFGVGKRACVGETFARARMFLYVTSLLQKFDILPPEDPLPLTDDSWESKGIRTMKPYRCVLRVRQ